MTRILEETTKVTMSLPHTAVVPSISSAAKIQRALAFLSNPRSGLENSKTSQVRHRLPESSLFAKARSSEAAALLAVVFVNEFNSLAGGFDSRSYNCIQLCAVVVWGMSVWQTRFKSSFRIPCLR